MNCESVVVAVVSVASSMTKDADHLPMMLLSEHSALNELSLTNLTVIKLDKEIAGRGAIVPV